MYSQYRFSDFNASPQSSSKMEMEIENCIFFDGISHFIQRNDRLVESLRQMIQQIYENETKEIYIHMFCKNANKVTDSCSDRIWVSISFTNQYHQESEKNNKQNLFVLYSGYPYSLNFFSIKDQSINLLRSILESSSHKKIFATQETANDAISIFFNYFKIKIKCAHYLSRDNSQWFTGLESFGNKQLVIDTINRSMECFQRNNKEQSIQIYNYTTKFQSKDPTETDEQSDNIILLSTFHWIMYFASENEIKLS